MKLSVAIISYNQRSYIRQCLDSVLMQHVDFDYEIVVSDDGSTDGTQEILQEYKASYPERIVLQLQRKNEGIAVNYQHVLKACKGEYIAICEADDYWTDNSKLQQQVDFLDTHPDYGFVGTYNHVLLPDGQQRLEEYNYFSAPQKEGDWELYGNLFDYAKYGPVTRTVSLCFRRSIIVPYLDYVGMGNDMVLQTILAKHSLFAKHARSMCVYRAGGVSSYSLSLEKQLYYYHWWLANRRLQKQLFPHDCNWDEDELVDKGTYIRLQYAIQTYQPRKALLYKRQIRSEAYKQKVYCRFLYGPVTCLLLHIYHRHSKKNGC